MTSAAVQHILHVIGLRPQQAAGQNFLLDESVVEAMVSAAGVEEGQTILEIGPGLGILTEALLATGAKVIAVELDVRLYAYLKKKFRGRENLRLVHQDIFKLNLNTILKNSEYLLVANLPYSATSLIFRNFLTITPRPSSMTVMIQRDVAKRITALPGEMSMVSLMVQYYSRPAMLFDVPPKSFFPSPKVFSSVVHCDHLQPVRPEIDEPLFRLFRAGFSGRRKQLHNTLSTALDIPSATAVQAIEKSGISQTARAQELSLEKWLTLAQNLS